MRNIGLVTYSQIPALWSTLVKVYKPEFTYKNIDNIYMLT